MRTVKLTKKMLSLDPMDLLVKLGAANKTSTFPQHVYVSKKDYTAIESAVRKMAKKQFPGYSKKHIDNVVGFEMLNYGPNSLLENALKPGFAVVDVDAIADCNRYDKEKEL